MQSIRMALSLAAAVWCFGAAASAQERPGEGVSQTTQVAPPTRNQSGTDEQ